MPSPCLSLSQESQGDEKASKVDHLSPCSFLQQCVTQGKGPLTRLAALGLQAAPSSLLNIFISSPSPPSPAKLTLQRRAYRKVMTMGPFDSMAFVSCGSLDSNGLALVNAPPTVTLEQLATLSIKVSVATAQGPGICCNRPGARVLLQPPRGQDFVATAQGPGLCCNRPGARFFFCSKANLQKI